MNWSFSAQIERFEGEGHVHFLALPKALVGGDGRSSSR